MHYCIHMAWLIAFNTLLDMEIKMYGLGFCPIIGAGKHISSWQGKANEKGLFQR